MRLKVSDLAVGKEYAIQVRATSGEDVSEWSPRFKFVTIRDDTQPKAPTNVIWVVSGDSYMAEWDSVTQDINNRPVSILRYGMRLRAGGVEHILPTTAAPETPGGRQRWDLLRQKAINLFNTIDAKSIEFSVRAVVEGPDGPIHSEWSTAILTSNLPPGPPTNGAAKGIIDGIVLTWGPSESSDVVGYRVFVGPDADFVPNPSMVANNDPNWVAEAGIDENYISGLEYTYYTSTYADHYFKVRAVDAYNQESTDLLIVGAPISPFVFDDTPPDIPGTIGAERDASDGSRVTVSWGAVTDENLAGYAIEYLKGTPPATGPWVGAGMAQAAPDATSFVVEGLDPYAVYNFRVRAFDTYANYSDWSGAVQVAEAPNPIPAAVTGVVVTPSQTEAKFNIVWDKHPDTDIVEYQVQIDRVNTFDGPNLRTYYTVGNTIEAANLVVGVDYFVRVRAVDSRADLSVIPWSTTVTVQANSFNPSDGAPPSTAPTVSVTNSIGMLYAYWPAVTNADPVTYHVHVSVTNDFTPGGGTKVGETASTSMVIRNTSGNNPLAYGTTYYVKVVPYDRDGAGPASVQASGSPKKVEDGDVESMAVGKLTTGTLDSLVITMGTGGEIRSSDYNNTNKTGWIINDAGINLYKGVVSASALTAGTISGTTINVGAGGVLNVDSTAVIKSNNYAAGTAGWRLTNTSLEVNNGSVSASLLTGGTLSAGIIYVSSGGGIHDSNGWWSITPNSINIQNGSINAAAITSGVMRSNALALDANGNSIAGEYAWQIDKDGDAVFGNTKVRGRIVVGNSSSTNSGAIQSYNWYSGSQGWNINSNGTVEFNQATINAGLFKSQNSSMRLEVGNTGYGDPVDEVRMFNNGGVASMRHLSGSLGTVYFNLYNGAIALRPTSDGWTAVGRGTAGPMLKFVSTDLQARNSSDSSYANFTAGSVTCTGGLTVSSQTDFNGNVFINGIGTGGTANMHISAAGRIYKISSSRRYKENITTAAIDTSRVLELEPKIFQRNNERDDDDNILPVTSKSPWHYGFIAEEADDLGLNGWTFSDLEGKTEGFAYDLWVVAQQAVLREHNEKIQTMESRISALEELLRSK